MIQLSRRAQVAAALSASGGAAVSGEAIAATLGISRVAVSKHVRALRDLGYEIDSAPRSGYRLLDAPDACMPEEVAPLLRDALWVACEGAAELASTNDESKRLARAGAPEGTAVVASSQSGGRGRLGRAWESPSGGVYASCILRPPLPPAAASSLSLVIATGVARGLASLGVETGLKWPNDVELGGRKLGGILLEMSAEADRVDWIVAGCGVNVVDAPAPGAACVREVAPHLRVASVAAAVLDGIASAYREFLTEGFEPARAVFVARSTLAGRRVTVRDAAGGVVGQGAVSGISSEAELELDGPEGISRVVAGEVTLRD